MNKKNLILTIIIAVLSVAGLTLGIISICGGFSVNESDCRGCRGKIRLLSDNV